MFLNRRDTPILSETGPAREGIIDVEVGAVSQKIDIGDLFVRAYQAERARVAPSRKKDIKTGEAIRADMLVDIQRSKTPPRAAQCSPVAIAQRANARENRGPRARK